MLVSSHALVNDAGFRLALSRNQCRQHIAFRAALLAFLSPKEEAITR